MGAESQRARNADTLAAQEDLVTVLARENPQAAMELVIREFRDRLFFHAFSIVKDAQEAYKKYEALVNQASGIGGGDDSQAAESVMRNITGGE